MYSAISSKYTIQRTYWVQRHFTF